VQDLKRAAGVRAAEFATSGMVLGLGSGSTAYYATQRIAQRLQEGSLQNIVGIPTSESTARHAREWGIPLGTLEEYPQVDLTIDGADEVDPHLDVIKGLGGCLLREKIVAHATRKEIIVVDESKLVERLGTRAPVPVEVIRFGWRNTEKSLAETGARTTLRLSNGVPFITDEGNYILDCHYESGIEDPAALASTLNSIPGVVENGLFLNMVKVVIVASVGGVRILER
jgi:ribose 5-phosphate isomerase A